MLVKCKACGNKKEKTEAFKVSTKGINTYYCNESEYRKIEDEKQNRFKLLKIIDEIFGYTITNTVLSKELSEISKSHTYTKTYLYVSENIKKLEKFMEKDFKNEYGKIKYFTTIIKNNIADYIPPKEDKTKDLEIELISSNYKSKEKKKTIEEYLAEME